MSAEITKKRIMVVQASNAYLKEFHGYMQRASSQGKDVDIIGVSGAGEAFRKYRQQAVDVVVIPGVMLGCTPQGFVEYVRRKDEYAMRKSRGEKTKGARIVVLDRNNIDGDQSNVKLVPNRWSYSELIEAIGV